MLDAVEERDDEPGWQRHVALVLDASFDLYSARRDRLPAVSERPRPSAGPRGGRLRRPLLAAALGALLFAAGIAVGQALHDNPVPGGTQTRVRTLRPLPLPPARRTVTVTSTRP